MLGYDNSSWRTVHYLGAEWWVLNPTLGKQTDVGQGSDKPMIPYGRQPE